MGHNREFSKTRLRRSRMKKFSRELVRENRLSAQDLIWPVFVIEGEKIRQPIKLMPGVYRLSIDQIRIELEQLVLLDLNSIALFPCIEPSLKDSRGSLALDTNNLICRTIKELKREFPALGIITDIALDPFTDHGHDGVLIGGDVDNDSTLQNLNEQALSYANAGCDILAPSDMMDGRVDSIRTSLESNNFKSVMIMSYAAKYASAFYGPFRNAVGSGKLVNPSNKKSYQLDYANSEEAMHEIAMDISEGADMIMIKPALPYLDIVRDAKTKFRMPTFVYQVSGEYSMIVAAESSDILNRKEVVNESLLCFKRAGADGIFTYFAPEVLKALKSD